jgi:hypothetical protein
MQKNFDFWTGFWTIFGQLIIFFCTISYKEFKQILRLKNSKSPLKIRYL